MSIWPLIRGFLILRGTLLSRSEVRYSKRNGSMLGPQHRRTLHLPVFDRHDVIPERVLALVDVRQCVFYDTLRREISGRRRGDSTTGE